MGHCGFCSISDCGITWLRWLQGSTAFPDCGSTCTEVPAALGDPSCLSTVGPLYVSRPSGIVSLHNPLLLNRGHSYGEKIYMTLSAYLEVREPATWVTVIRQPCTVGRLQQGNGEERCDRLCLPSPSSSSSSSLSYLLYYTSLTTLVTLGSCSQSPVNQKSHNYFIHSFSSLVPIHQRMHNFKKTASLFLEVVDGAYSG